MTDDICEAVRHTCILATVRLRTLGLNRTDRDASRTIERAENAQAGTARVLVSRLGNADALHRKIVSAQQEARQTLIKYSMPYGNDDGWRLLPNSNFEKFIAELAVCKKKIEALKVELAKQAPAIIAQARADVGNLSVPLPSVDELVSAYGFDYELREVAEGKFPGLPESTAVKLRRHSQAKLTAAIEAAQADTLNRFLTPLGYFVERMRAYDQREADIAAGKDVGRTGVFRDSVVENIKELAAVVDSFNVAGDPRMAELAEKVKALSIEPDALRRDAGARAAATAQAQDIVSSLNEWLVPAVS